MTDYFSVGFSKPWDIIRGDSTSIFRQLNCRAKMGFDSITSMLRFLLSSECLQSGSCVLSLCSEDGLNTFAGDVGFTLNLINRQVKQQSLNQHRRIDLLGLLVSIVATEILVASIIDIYI